MRTTSLAVTTWALVQLVACSPKPPVTQAAPNEAQQPKTADERAVWSLIETSGRVRPKVTDDFIFVSGAYPRPLIGRQPLGMADSATRVASAAVRKRSNESTAAHPIKVVVAMGGDMAYGFALFDLAFDQPDSAGNIQHVSLEGSQLTVWRKVAGEWLLAASFSRPNR